MSETKTAPKLSRVKPGYWRNWYQRSGPRVRLRDGCDPGPDGTFFGRGKWPSAEVAEQFYLKLKANPEPGWRLAVYPGPVFFPSPTGGEP